MARAVVGIQRRLVLDEHEVGHDAVRQQRLGASWRGEDAHAAAQPFQRGDVRAERGTGPDHHHCGTRTVGAAFRRPELHRTAARRGVCQPMEQRIDRRSGELPEVPLVDVPRGRNQRMRTDRLFDGVRRQKAIRADERKEPRQHAHAT
jgi:hypothetical protein